jgi:hypothetical protein
MTSLRINNLSKTFICCFTSWILIGCLGSESSVESGGQEPDPVVVDFPIAYIKRPLPLEMDNNGNQNPVVEDIREPIAFNPGAALFIRQRATPSASETNITARAFIEDGDEETLEEDVLYDVKDVEVSYDGEKLIFAMRAPDIEGADDDEQPKWNIWQYDRTTDELRRIITSDITAEAGHDVAPHYLPGGKIVFASTRQRSAKAILLDEGKPQFSALEEDRNVEALSLHVMNDDGSEIKQITYNQSHDTDPSVLSNGKIVFSRWDNYGRNAFNLYQVNPDGTGLEILYGMASHDAGFDGIGPDQSTVEFMAPREYEDGRVLVQLKTESSTRLGGEFALVDWQNYIDLNQTTILGVDSGEGGHVSATPFAVRSDDTPSIGGRFANVYPFYDASQRLLISWTPCRLDAVDENDEPIIVACTEENLAVEGVTEAAPLYGVWIYDYVKQTQVPVVTGQEGIVTHEAVALAPRTQPTFIADTTAAADPELLSGNLGVIHIQSVYDFDGIDQSPDGIDVLADPLQTTAAQRPARFIRIVKAVSMPDDDLVDLDGTAFGRSQAQLMRDILGYALVEPDGSAKFKVPADVAFAISVLDENGKRITPRHQNWITLQAGEQKECKGCHTRNSELPHGRYDAQADSINLGAAASQMPFPNTNPSLIAEAGETMAEVNARINGIAELSVDINYIDIWTDETLRPADPPITLRYNDLTTPLPTSFSCINQWSGRCRVTINYPDTIQPIWELDRQVFDDMGNLIEDNTCTSCHSPVDAMSQVQVPVAQLELVATQSTDEPDHLTSYREIMFNDNAQEIVNGALLDQQIPAVDGNGDPIFEVDENGDLILDGNGNPIQVINNVPVLASMSVNGARLSPRFFSLFEAGGSHQDRLTPAELKLISEWLDIGGQYYNNPFDVPQ